MKEIVKQYLAANKKLMPIARDGVPLLMNWTSNSVRSTDAEIMSWITGGGNIGWVIGDGDLVIDVDPRNGGDKSLENLLKRFSASGLRAKLIPTVNTPRGGQHYYLKMSDGQWGDGIKLRKTLNRDYPGIDFLSKGSYCGIAGNMNVYGEYLWSDGDFGMFEQRPAPIEIVELLSYKVSGLIIGKGIDLSNTLELGEEGDDSDDESFDADDLEAMIGGKSAGRWSREKVLEMLECLDNNMPNDEWVKVGMALHDWKPYRGEGGGLQLWEEWSRGGDSYKEGETEKRWRSFDLMDKGGVTLGTISYMVKDAKFDEVSMKVGILMTKVEKADEKELEFTVIPELRRECGKLGLSRINKEKLVKAVQDRYKELTGLKMPISGIRQQISVVDHNDGVISGSFIENGSSAPAWCDNWVYVNSHTGFIDKRSLQLHKSESFNIENGIYIPMTEAGSKASASKYVADNGYMTKVDGMAYLPMNKDIICDVDGMKVLNSFNPKTVPLEAEEYTEKGLEVVRRVVSHIKLICGNDADARILTQWLAHQVQFPGVQILWSPIIQSIQGVGKSFFGELLRVCLGDRNVGTVSPTQITSDFNGWATNVIVTILEELRVQGHNRYEAVNALKPLITDRMIQINEKGVKPYMTYNTSNYMCFTNHKDAIPMDTDDRRWWVKFVEIESLEHLEKIVGEPVNMYFGKLFSGVRASGCEVRKWLLGYAISPEFLEIKQAPMTDCKMSMIATEESSFEGLSELKELIEKGHKYYNSECISSPDLFEQFMFEHPEVDTKSTKRYILLKKLGYMQLPTTVKIDGKMRRVWTKKFMTNEEVRLSFNEGYKLV